jgi:RNA polymerase sigma factor (sigma-70 family)
MRKDSAIADMQACVPALRRYASALLCNRSMADDLVHDCLVRALGRLHTRQEEDDIRPWLFAVMHELLVSRPWRGKLRAVTQTHYAEDVGAPNDSAGQDNGIGERDPMRIVRNLPEEQRKVLLLVTVEGLSYADTAHVLRVPIDIVMSQLSLARDKLRRTSSDIAMQATRRVK